MYSTAGFEGCVTASEAVFVTLISCRNLYYNTFLRKMQRHHI